MKRKQINKGLRFDVFNRDKFTCQYCGRMAPDVVLEIDHIIPVSGGGVNHIENLTTSCLSCNRGKSKKLLTSSAQVKRINMFSKPVTKMHFLCLIGNKKKLLEASIERLQDGFLCEFEKGELETSLNISKAKGGKFSGYVSQMIRELERDGFIHKIRSNNGRKFILNPGIFLTELTIEKKSND